MRTAVALLALSTLALADGTAELVQRIFHPRDDADRAAATEALAASAADPREVAKRFADGRAYTEVEDTGWSRGKVRGGDGKYRPYLLYVPDGYTPTKRYPFLVDMHGGVSRTPPLTADELEQMKFFWAEHAESEGWFLAIPAGEKDAEWWTEAGSAAVLRLLAETRREYNLDENRVFATGFSDGGSGSFYLALAAPTPLAGVVPLNGHVAVAQAGGLQVHLRSFANVPIYAVNTTDDSLYPSASVKPLIDSMRELGVPVTWRDIPGRHDPSYLPEERPAIAAWMAKQVRDPHPKSILWEGAAPGRVRWLAVTEVRGGAGKEFPDVNPPLPPTRPRIGVVIDQEFEGKGLRIADVQQGTAAAAIGVAKGDILVAFDGNEMKSLRDLQLALRGKTHGDAFKLGLRRGEDAIEKEGKFPEARAEPGLGREKPHGVIRAEAKDNAVEVLAEGIAAFEIYLGEPPFDLSKPLTVTVNGKVVHSGVVAPDLRFLVEQAAADDDRTMIYLARLKLEIK